jgi:hypothetical protein
MKSQCFDVESSVVTDLDLTVELIEPRLEMAALDLSMLAHPVLGGLFPDRCSLLPWWYGPFKRLFGC